jgi:predicted nucleic acid-binding protein
MARYTVVLDACVLVPIALADTLLRVAERDLYRPLWSERILDEAADAILDIHSSLDPQSVSRRFTAMRETFEDACVEGWESVDLNLVLPDPDDRHVVAAAVRGKADAIVTANLRDYPPDDLKPFDLEVIHPDDFLLDQLDLAPRIVIEVIQEQAAHARRPPLDPIDLLVRLARCGAPGFADEARRLI